MIILDTNVISALMRPEMNEVVAGWADAQTKTLLWTTSVSIMEVRIGLILMPDGARKQGLQRGFEALVGSVLSDRILPLDKEAAEVASRIAVVQMKRGINADIGDYQIAGIVQARRATLATRNVKDFADLDIPLVNPWQT